MNKKRKNTKDSQSLRMVLQELNDNPYRQFKVAFCLTSLIPFLVFFYLLVGRIGTFDVLTGNIGWILGITVFIVVCGFYFGYIIIKKILKRVIFYAIKAKRSDQLKSVFVASVSHELKNPLSIIKMNLFNMLKGLAGEINNEQRRIVELCRNVTDRMSCLVNNLLDLHKIEVGMVEIRRELCDFTNILETQVRELESGIKKKNIKLVKNLVTSNLFMWLDGDKITQVVNNILGNAVKYTPEGGRITLNVTCNQELVRLECADSGSGIPADKTEKIFDKFERIGSLEEGTGLGLAIAKDIVELHKGRIWVESLLGKGSNFIVVLPRNLRRTKKENNAGGQE